MQLPRRLFIEASQELVRSFPAPSFALRASVNNVFSNHS